MTVPYGCTDPAGFGLVSRRWADRNHTPTTGRRRRTGRGETGSDTAARLTQEQQAAAEAKKAERRQLIAGNKQADAAQAVRRAYLRQCLTVKSKHKAMAGWALEGMIQRDPTFCRCAGEYHSRPAILAELLGGDPRQITADTSPARRGLILPAQVATANEEACRETHAGTVPLPRPITTAPAVPGLRAVRCRADDRRQTPPTRRTGQQTPPMSGRPAPAAATGPRPPPASRARR